MRPSSDCTFRWLSLCSGAGKGPGLVRAVQHDEAPRLGRIRLAASAVATLLLLCGTGAREARGQDAYEEFNAFAAAHFGALHEEEVLRHFGPELVQPATGRWRYVSERSAVIGWQTSLPARGHVEFGTSTDYGHKTEPEERPFFLHLHYLTDLRPGTEIHYRLVAEDDRGRVVMSDDLTLTPRLLAEAIHLPQDIPGPPFTLDQDGATYIVTTDIVAPATAFNLSGRQLTLDLGGHTVTYDQVAGSADPMPPGRYGVPRPRGARSSDGSSVTIVNGMLEQGAGAGTADPYGYQPIHLYNPRQCVVAGMTLKWHGAQVTGLEMYGEGAGSRVHHNVLLDLGTEIADRHQGLDAIVGAAGTDAAQAVVDHNLVKRTRHRGIRASRNARVHSNEVYLDSWATNSYGVMYYSGNADRPVVGVEISRNRIFGTGYHPIGVGSGYHAREVRISGNYIQMQAQTPAAYRWPPGPGDPPGQLQTVNGIRYHKGPQRDVVFDGNTVVVKGRGTADEPAWMRGLWVTPLDGAENVVFRGNRVKQVAQNDYADGHAVAALGGREETPTQIGYERNTLLANTANIRFGDNYGHGGNHHFSDTAFVRLGNDPRYATLKLGWQGWNYDTFGHTLLDSTFQGGAGYDLVAFEGASQARQEFAVLWRLGLTTEPQSQVVVHDLLGDVVFDEELPDGHVEGIPLTEYVRQRERSTYHTPHRILATSPEHEPARAEVTMDRPRHVTLGGDADERSKAYLPYAARQE